MCGRFEMRRAKAEICRVCSFETNTNKLSSMGEGLPHQRFYSNAPKCAENRKKNKNSEKMST
jgi:hypothetical protein